MEKNMFIILIWQPIVISKLHKIATMWSASMIVGALYSVASKCYVPTRLKRYFML